MGIYNSICHWCLCRVCTLRKCPRNNHCLVCLYRWPVKECDFFENRYMVGIRRIRKRKSNPKRFVTFAEYEHLLKVLDDVVKRLDKKGT